MSPQQAKSGPLSGFRVVEFSVFMAGPVCGLLLSDMGAEVIKVERVPDGDDSRRMIPPAINGEPASFMIVNRGKKAVAIDAKHPEGVAVLKRLCASADIVIENFRPGVLDRLGLGYEDLSRDHPELVYGTITGFGLTGPAADRAGLDLIAQAFSGLMSITGEGPGRPPIKVGAPVTDTTAGFLLASGVLAALVSRLKTGRGQRVETSLIEAGIAHTYWQSAMALATGISGGPLGSAHPLSAPYQAYRCRDGWIILGAPSDSLFRAATAAIGLPALADDPRFSASPVRLGNRDALNAVLDPAFAALGRDEALAALNAAGVPCGPVNSITDMLSDEQTRARDMVVTVDHPQAGRVEALGCPVKFSRTPVRCDKAAPCFGEDNAAVLEDIGYGAEEIARLADAGVLHAPRLPEAVAE